MPYSNPILAGEELIRSGIRSENYVPNVDGWRIGADGYAEFFNALIRGDLVVYDPNTGNSLEVEEFAGDLRIEWNFPATNKTLRILGELNPNNAGQPRLSMTTQSPTLTASQYMDGGSTGCIAWRSSATGAPSAIFRNSNGYLYRGSYGSAANYADWVNLPLVNGWAAYSDVTWTQATPQYKVMPDGTVRLRGLLTPPMVIVAGQTIATLPNTPNYANPRPLRRKRITPLKFSAGAGNCEFDIAPTGAITLAAWGMGGAGVQLDGWSYDIDS